MINSLKEKIYSHRKMRRPHQSGHALLNGFARRRNFTEPAGRADNGVDAQPGESAYIFRRRVRCREINSHIHAAQRFVRERLGVNVVVAIEFRAHLKSIRRRELLDEAPHLSVSDDGKAKAHAPLLPVARSCVARRAYMYTASYNSFFGLRSSAVSA